MTLVWHCTAAQSLAGTPAAFFHPVGRPRVTRGGAAPRSSPFDGDGVEPARNVLGGDLQCCCANVRETGVGTGFFRDGHCSTGPQDVGRHTVCVEVTAEFLAFTKAVGNDLSTPVPEFMFPGLLPGDRWCLCAQRWAQAHAAGFAPRVYLRSTHERTLKVAPLDVLREYALDGAEADADLARLSSLREQLEQSFKQA